MPTANRNSFTCKQETVHFLSRNMPISSQQWSGNQIPQLWIQSTRRDRECSSDAATAPESMTSPIWSSI